MREKRETFYCNHKIWPPVFPQITCGYNEVEGFLMKSADAEGYLMV